MKLGAKQRAQIVQLLTARYRRRMALIYETSRMGAGVFTALHPETLARNPALARLVADPNDNEALDELVAQTLYLCRYPTRRSRVKYALGQWLQRKFWRKKWYAKVFGVVDEAKCASRPARIEALPPVKGYWSRRA